MSGGDSGSQSRSPTNLEQKLTLRERVYNENKNKLKLQKRFMTQKIGDWRWQG